MVEAKEAVDVAARSASTAADELTVLLEHAMVAADEGRNAASMLRLDRSRLEAELSAVRQTLKETKHTLLAELATAKEAAERELSMTTGTSFAGFSGRELRGLEEGVSGGALEEPLRTAEGRECRVCVRRRRRRADFVKAAVWA